jgi:uncharacterized protein (DUF1015 family)
VLLAEPFAGLRPAPEYASAVAAPPYDVVSTEEARRLAQGRPWSFLHVSKPEIDLPPGTDPYSEAAYAQAAQSFRRMLHAGVLRRDARPAYYAYRMTHGAHSQTGVVIAAALDAYRSNRIRRHEHTRPDKEDDRVRQIAALNAQTGPVLLAYPAAPAVDARLAQACAQAPEIEVTCEGVAHAVWAIADEASMRELTAAFDVMPALYIADGHHRSAAAARVADARRAAHPSEAEGAPCNRFLAVAFPHHRMRILPYNRVVRDLRGMSAPQFLARVRHAFSVEASAGAVQPVTAGEFGLYLGGRWYRLRIEPGYRASGDPVEQLDVSLLSRHLLAPVLGISDPRTDARIDFVGGSRGTAELERRVDAGEMAAAFALCPTRMEDLMAVADAGEVMPPKSTWFEPKLADGLVSYPLD